MRKAMMIAVMFCVACIGVGGGCGSDGPQGSNPSLTSSWPNGPTGLDETAEVVTTPKLDEKSSDEPEAESDHELLYDVAGNQIARGLTLEHQNSRSFYVTRCLSHSSDSRADPRPLYERERRKLTPVERFLCDKLVKIEGVELVTFSSYAVRVQLAELFDWDEIEEKIVAVLATMFDDDVVEAHYEQQKSFLLDHDELRLIDVTVGDDGKIVVGSPYGRPYRRNFYVNRLITRNRIESVSFPLPDHGLFSTRYGNLNPFQQSLVQELNQVDGIRDVWFHPYGVNIDIGEAFDWEAVQPQILEALQKTFGVSIEKPEEPTKEDDRSA